MQDIKNHWLLAFIYKKYYIGNLSKKFFLVFIIKWILNQIKKYKNYENDQFRKDSYKEEIDWFSWFFICILYY